MARLLAAPRRPGLLVRVRAHTAIRSNTIHDRCVFFESPAGRHVTRIYTAATGHRMPRVIDLAVPEGPGVWRAQAITVLGPILTGRSSSGDPTPSHLRGLHMRYPTTVEHEDELDFAEVVKQTDLSVSLIGTRAR